MASSDASGTVRTYVGTDPTGSGPNGLVVFDARGNVRIGVEQSAARGNAFFLQDPDGTTLRGALTATDSGSRSVSISLMRPAQFELVSRTIPPLTSSTGSIRKMEAGTTCH